MSNQNKIRFANTARFLFNGDKAIILNRLNGTWLKMPRQCYDIIRLCEEDELSIAELSAKLADDDDRAYMTELIGLLDSMGCLYYDSQRSVDNVSFAVTHRCNLNCIHCMVEAECNSKEQHYFKATPHN